jgi:putative addiction module component (TIGR02574 family)
MPTNPSHFLADLLALPVTQRADIAARLLESLEPGTDPDAEAAWDQEIRERLDQLRSGRVNAVPLDEALKQIMDDADRDEC